jgi:ABC-type Fe3+-siderophore transport system permease subunit
MSAQQKESLSLPRKLGDRLLLVVFSTVLAGFFALMSQALQQRTPTGWLAKLLHGLAVETMFTFCIFSFLALVWALFTPRWLEALLGQSFAKVLTTIGVVLAATVLTILYYTI